LLVKTRAETPGNHGLKESQSIYLPRRMVAGEFAAG